MELVTTDFGNENIYKLFSYFKENGIFPNLPCLDIYAQRKSKYMTSLKENNNFDNLGEQVKKFWNHQWDKELFEKEVSNALLEFQSRNTNSKDYLMCLNNLIFIIDELDEVFSFQGIFKNEELCKEIYFKTHFVDEKYNLNSFKNLYGWPLALSLIVSGIGHIDFQNSTNIFNVFNNFETNCLQIYTLLYLNLDLVTSYNGLMNNTDMLELRYQVLDDSIHESPSVNVTNNMRLLFFENFNNNKNLNLIVDYYFRKPESYEETSLNIRMDKIVGLVADTQLNNLKGILTKYNLDIHLNIDQIHNCKSLFEKSNIEGLLKYSNDNDKLELRITTNNQKDFNKNFIILKNVMPYFEKKLSDSQEYSLVFERNVMEVETLKKLVIQMRINFDLFYPYFLNHNKEQLFEFLDVFNKEFLTPLLFQRNFRVFFKSNNTEQNYYLNQMNILIQTLYQENEAVLGRQKHNVGIIDNLTAKNKFVSKEIFGHRKQTVDVNGLSNSTGANVFKYDSYYYLKAYLQGLTDPFYFNEQLVDEHLTMILDLFTEIAFIHVPNQSERTMLRRNLNDKLVVSYHKLVRGDRIYMDCFVHDFTKVDKMIKLLYEIVNLKDYKNKVLFTVVLPTAFLGFVNPNYFYDELPHAIAKHNFVFTDELRKLDVRLEQDKLIAFKVVADNKWKINSKERISNFRYLYEDSNIITFLQNASKLVNKFYYFVLLKERNKLMMIRIKNNVLVYKTWNLELYRITNVLAVSSYYMRAKKIFYGKFYLQLNDDFELSRLFALPENNQVGQNYCGFNLPDFLKNFRQFISPNSAVKLFKSKKDYFTLTDFFSNIYQQYIGFRFRIVEYYLKVDKPLNVDTFIRENKFETFTKCVQFSFVKTTSGLNWKQLIQSVQYDEKTGEDTFSEGNHIYINEIYYLLFAIIKAFPKMNRKYIITILLKFLSHRMKIRSTHYINDKFYKP